MNAVRTPTDPFAERVEQETDIYDPEAQRQALGELAELLHARRLTPIALFVLESMRPLTFVTAEFLVFLEPFARIFLPPTKYRLIVEAMHDRKNVSWLIDRLEALADGRATADSAAANDGPEPGGNGDRDPHAPDHTGQSASRNGGENARPQT